MDLGFVGLGKMGLNMVTRLLQSKDHRVVVWNRSRGPIDDAASRGAVAADSLKDVVAKLKAPRCVWIMVPDSAVEGVLAELVPLLAKGDLVIDGGNCNWRDSVRRAKQLREKGIGWCDAGTSGGIWGLKVGYCLMVGGEKADFARIEPALATLAPPDGYLHVGGPGSGHFVKMVHNGIEYGMMQSYAEGFEILEKSSFDLDLRAVSHLWNQGSVVRSWLLELAERMFEEDGKLERLDDWVADSGEGRWTVQTAIDQDVPAPVITLALLARLRSRQDESFSAKVLAGLRNQFGGHAVKSK